MGMIDQERIFADRHEAGFELGKLLLHKPSFEQEKYRNQHALVLGIPRGGVVIAYEIAKLLHAELSVIVTKKLPHPLQEEFAIGAVAEEGSVYLTSFSKGISEETINKIINQQEKEIQSRIQRFRNGNPLPSIKDRTVIIADDGIATGATIVPAINLCRKKRAAKIIVAAPVSGTHYVSEIDDLADDVVIATQPEMFFAVGQVYDDFHHVLDEEVTGLLKDFDKHYKVQA